MDGRGRRVVRFNWRLALVVVLAAAVLGVTLYLIRDFRRTYMARQGLEKGSRAYDERDWEGATRYLGRYVAVHRKDSAVLMKYADALLHIQPQKEANVRGAIAAYRQILRDDPSHAQAGDRVSEIYLRLGMPGEAEMITRRRLEAADDARAREILALALAGQRKFDEAADVLSDTISKYPSQSTARKLLADLMRERPAEVPGSPEAQLRAAVEHDPSDLGAQVALADHLLRYDGSKSARDRALAILTGARSLQAKDPSDRVRLADALLTAGDAEAARAEIAAVAKADPRLLAAWVVWARLVRLAGSREEAAEVARLALAGLGNEEYPFLPQAVELFLFAGLEREAAAAVERMELQDPLSAELPLLKGLLAQRGGRPREAVKYWREAARSPDAPARLRLALAEAYEAAGEFRAAARELRAAINREPGSVDARVRLAAILLRRGEVQAAADAAALARSMAPSDIEACIVDIAARSRIAAASGSAADALSGLREEAEALLARSPSNARAVALAAELASASGDTGRVRQLTARLAADTAASREAALMEVSALWRAGDRDGAIARMRALLGEVGESPAGVEQLAGLLAWSGKTDEAVRTLQEAAERVEGGTNLAYRLALGRLHLMTGAAPDARRVFEDAASAFPDDVASRYHLAAVTLAADPRMAQRCLDEIKRLDGETPKWRLHQAGLYIQSPDWRSRQGEAVALLQENVRFDPDDLESRVLLGTAQEKSGNFRLAVETYRRAFEGSPDSAVAAFHLIGALQKTGDLEEADKVLDEVARRGVSQERLAGLRLGQQVLEGDIATAAGTAEEMLIANPDNLMLKVFIARLRMRQGDLAAARSALEGLDQDDPNVAVTAVDLLLREKRGDDALAVCARQIDKHGSILSLVLRARTFIVLGRLDDAEKDYRAVAAKEPDKAQGWVLLADFLASRGKTVDAVDSLRRALDAEAHYPGAVVRLTRLYSASADPAERSRAFDVLDAAMAAYPDNLDFPLHKAAALLARGTARSLTDARALLDDVTRRDSARVQAWMMLAQAALADGSPDSALEAVARGMGLAPAAGARRRLLMLKADAEKARWPALAAATLRGLWEENRADAAVATALAQALRSAGDADGAVSVLQSLRKGVQGDAAVALDLAIADCMSAGGRVDAALAAVREAAPAGDPRAALVSCLILARAGRWDQAVSTLAAWQAAHPDDAGTLLAAARAFMETVTPNPARAKEVLEMVASRHGGKTAVLAALAAACQAAGEIDRAEDLYRRVLDSSASDPMALNNLAWILCEERRRPADALPLADKGRALYPEMADMADTRAVIYHRLGRHSDAERELRFCLDQAAPGSTASAAARLHLSRLLIERERGAEAVPVLKDLFSKPQLVAALGAAERAEAEAMRQTLGFAPAL